MGKILCKRYKYWKDLNGQQITLLEYITTSLGTHKRKYKATFCSTVKYTHFPTIKVKDIKLITNSNIIKEIDVNEFHYSKESYLGQQYGLRYCKDGKTLINLAKCKVITINNSRMYSLFGPSLNDWPLFALQAYFLRTLLTKLTQVSKKEINKLGTTYINDKEKLLEFMIQIRTAPIKKIKEIQEENKKYIDTKWKHPKEIGIKEISTEALQAKDLLSNLFKV